MVQPVSGRTSTKRPRVGLANSAVPSTRENLRIDDLQSYLSTSTPTDTHVYSLCPLCPASVNHPDLQTVIDSINPRHSNPLSSLFRQILGFSFSIDWVSEQLRPAISRVALSRPIRQRQKKTPERDNELIRPMTLP